MGDKSDGSFVLPVEGNWEGGSGGWLVKAGGGNVDPWAESGWMGEGCGRRGTHRVGCEKQEDRAVCFLGINVMEKGKGCRGV